MKSRTLLIALLAVIVYMPGFAQAAEPPEPKLTLISNVNIFDGKNEKLHMNMHVLVKDNRIETISSEPLAVIQTDNVTIIDGGGRTLMPGLIDAHWHTMFNFWPISKALGSNFGELSIAAAIHAKEQLLRGFTTVRDIGGNVFGVKNAIDSGLVDGPRIYPSGPYITNFWTWGLPWSERRA